ncbi:FK506-binding protein 1 [Seminavis robusta]|uniref:peptidylprolyl isomerase n=1 Tax=Seminavis robusta TaxID=568900 RepID=A0A9N8HIQ7_9STRA|nr:FK506-binding protein 1 [Seminavis robusta]|eukprot:Sro802_g204560.1 FK506-binding protein 1 (286) ;mRNA; r:5487-6436
MNALSLLLLVVSTAHAFAPAARNHARSSALRSAAAAESVADGLVKTVTKAGQGLPVQLGDIATVKYSCYLPNEPKTPPFSKSNQQKIVIGDGTMIQGWDKAIRTMRIGERAVVRISDPALGYGNVGVPPLVPPGAEIEFDLEILDSQPPMANIDFDNLAMADSTPRTAQQISDAYEVRRAQMALEPELEGLEGWIAKAKNFYFFGLFEGETGQQAPWFLRPSITFPIAFLVVGAAFYISYASGAITERGAQVTDELDEIILSSAASDPAGFLLAMTSLVSNSIEI